MIRIVWCQIIRCEERPELNGLIINVMKINSVNMKDKGTGVKVKQPSLRELILGVEGRLGKRIDDVETRLSARIDDVETRLSKRMDEIDSRLDRNNLIK